MSWLGDLAHGIGGVFGYDVPSTMLDSVAPNISGLFDGSSSSGGGISNSFLSALIQGGTGLAGTYATLNANKSIAEQQLEQAQNELALKKELTSQEIGAKLAAAKIAAGATVKAAKMQSLSSLYSNYASDKEKAGASLEQGALELGRNATAPILQRLGAR